MLYVSTADPNATYTAQQTLLWATGDDGGLFVPLRLPEYDREELRQLLALPFWTCVCQVLNRFFPLWLQPEDLGKLSEPELLAVRHKVTVAQLWDRQTGQFRGLKDKFLGAMGCGLEGDSCWPELAVEIGLMIGLYGLLRRRGILPPGSPLNLAVSASGFQLPMAAAYVRQMGIPVGVCICVCGENTLLWELFHRGEARMETLSGDGGRNGHESNIPRNLERLVLQRLGVNRARAFMAAIHHRKTFSLNQEEHLLLGQGFGVSVVSGKRAISMIPRIYRNADCLLSPHSAMIYSGLLDYRSADGRGEPVVLLAEESPMKWGEYVLGAMKIPVESVTGQIEALEMRAAKRRKGS